MFGLLELALSVETTGGIVVRHFSQSNPESNARPFQSKTSRRRSLSLASPWWDLSDVKTGLDRKEFVREMAGVQDRLSALVPYLDNLRERSVLVEAWHVLEKGNRGRGGEEME